MMSLGNKASGKVVTHIAFLCRISANLLFIFFLVGSIFSILATSAENLGTWRINFSNQLMERSHLPIIAIALYSLSLIVKEERKHPPVVYWKRLTIVSSLGIILYATCLLNNSERAYSEIRKTFPTRALDNKIKEMKSSVDQINSLEEAKIILDNSSRRSGKDLMSNDDNNIESIKNRIKIFEEELLVESFKIQEKKFKAANRRAKFESIRFIIYSLIFIIFYLKLAIFFNRLQKAS